MSSDSHIGPDTGQNTDDHDPEQLTSLLRQSVAGPAHSQTPQRRARYARLAERIREAIQDGTLTLGARLPAERVLARDIGVSRGTVVAAYKLLREEGVLIGQQGSGTRIASHSSSGSAPSAVLNREPRGEVISFAMANLPATSAVQEAIASLSAKELRPMLATNGYMPLGLLDLRQAIADYYTDLGVPTSTEEILVTTGAQQAIHLVANELLDSAARVLVEDPTYSGALQAFRSAGAALVPIPVVQRDDGLRSFESACTTGEVRVAYVMPVHNPTGSVAAPSCWERVGDIARQNEITVLEDRTLSQLAFSKPVPPPLATSMPNRTIIVESLSKTLWGGLRVGWVRAHSDLIRQLVGRKATLDISSSLLGQLVAAHLLPEVKRVRRDVIERAQHRLQVMCTTLKELLPEWSWEPPEGGLSLWIRMPADARELVLRALDYGVDTVPGSVMSTTTGFNDYIRLGYVLEPPIVEQGIQRLAAAWRDFKSEPALSGSLVVV